MALAESTLEPTKKKLVIGDEVYQYDIDTVKMFVIDRVSEEFAFSADMRFNIVYLDDKPTCADEEFYPWSYTASREMIISISMRMDLLKRCNSINYEKLVNETLVNILKIAETR